MILITALVEKYQAETNWLQKCIILHAIHLGMVSEYPNWRIRDTAMMLKIGIGTCSEDLHLAECYDYVKDCTSRNAALKELKK